MRQLVSKLSEFVFPHDEPMCLKADPRIQRRAEEAERLRNALSLPPDSYDRLPDSVSVSKIRALLDSQPDLQD